MLRRAVLSIIFLIPSGLIAAPSGNDLAGWNYEPLRDDLRVTELFTHDVQSMDDRSIGRVRDALVGADGDMQAVVIEFRHASGGSYALARLQPADVALQPDEETVTVSLGSNTADGASTEAGDGRFMQPPQGVPAQALLGMTVAIDGNDDFATVKDILIDTESRRFAALLIESRESGRVYALPIASASINADKRHVYYPYSKDRITSLDDFESRGDD